MTSACASAYCVAYHIIKKMSSASRYRYPKVRKEESSVEELHGVKVPDPYRWLEDPDSSETERFVEAQNDISRPFLQSCPLRSKFHSRLTELYNYPKYSCPSKRGKRYFYSMNTGLQNQSVMYVQDSLDGKAEVFFDPNTLSDDGTVALSSRSFSEDGELFAYALSASGSDWNTIHVMNVGNREKLSDELKWVKFSGIAWTHDHKGFFYQRYPEPDTKSAGTETTQVLGHQVYYHRVGTDQGEDVMCYEDKNNRDWIFGIEVSDCGRYVVLYITKGAEPRAKIYYCDLKEVGSEIQGVLPMEKLIDNFDSAWDFVCNEGTVFTFLTDCNAPRYRVVNIDISSPGKENWKTLVAEHQSDVLEWVACINTDKLVLCYLQDVKSVMLLHNLSDGQLVKRFPLAMGSVGGYSGKRHHTEMFYSFVSFFTPGIFYRCDLTSHDLASTVFRKTEVKGFDETLFEAEQVFYSSKDGTKIPMFILHRKGISLDGSHPLYLYGYGGFNISLTPSFSTTRVIFMQHMGGICAVPNLRGGGEYGDEWHKGGILERKQNVFDDFIAAAEYLVANKYTNSRRLSIHGGSNGGLLVCAVANQRPDLFQSVVSQVGVLDMLRFHKFTIGHAWCTDFGNPDKAEDFKFIYKYSPLHNVRVPSGDDQYPAMLLLTADHDDRVVPLHSFKYISQVQDIMGDEGKQTNPLLIRIETKAGHGAGKPTTKIIDENADIYGFVGEVLNIDWID